ncbi:MAG: hypothetical protein C0507_03645 [Cyanobacteria bacterium PR.3.49]|nr:hypothetical protein [Cyanobacteria bacterium PR.3.49]
MADEKPGVDKSAGGPPAYSRREHRPTGVQQNGRFPYFEQINRPDAPLTPHDFYPRIKLIERKVPTIRIAPEAYKRMQLYVELARLEVGWLGTAERLESGDFYIEHVFLLTQNAGAAHAKISEEGQMDLYKHLIQSGRREDTRRLFFWGHSHVRMETLPSPQDDATMVELQEQGNKWFIRGILNKLGRAQFDVYLYESNLQFIDVPWEIWSPQPVAEEAPKTGLAAVAEGLGGLKQRVVKGTKRFIESLSNDPVVKPRTQMRGPLPISDELRAEVEAEIREKVTISYLPDLARGYGELPLLEDLARERDAEIRAQGEAPAEASEGAPGAAPAEASEETPGAAPRAAAQIPGPPEALPPVTTKSGE